MLSVWPHEIHGFIDSVKYGLVVDVISLGDHIGQLFFIDLFFTLQFDLLYGLLDHALSFLLQGQVELHVEYAQEGGVQLFVLHHVLEEGALGPVELVLQLGPTEQMELVQRLMVDWSQECVQELRATLSYLGEDVLYVGFDCLQGGVYAGDQLLVCPRFVGKLVEIRLFCVLIVRLLLASSLVSLELVKLVELCLDLRLLQRDLCWNLFWIFARISLLLR